MKKIRKLLITVLLSLCAVFALLGFSGCDFKDVITGQIVKKGGITYEKDENGNSYIIRACNSSVKKVKIESFINNLPVGFSTGVFSECYNLTNIEVFEDNKWLKSINGNLYNKDGTKLMQYAIGKKDELFVIPDSVTEIGWGAFEGCRNLKSIIIPDSVTKIDAWAFSECYNLISMVIPNSIKKIDIRTFNGCSSLRSIILPDSVTEIGVSAFKGCSSLTSIIIPDSVTEIGWDAFEGCNNLTIYCETRNKPSDWDRGWNYSNCPVVWGYTGKN